MGLPEPDPTERPERRPDPVWNLTNGTGWK